MKLFVQLLQHPVTSSLLGQNILSFLFSKTHCLCVFFPLWETSFTSIQYSRQNYSVLYWNLYIFRKQTRRCGGVK